MWKAIKGLEGYYEASDDGQIKSLARSFIAKSGQRFTVRERILKPALTRYGYLKVSIYVDGKKLTRFVHKLVALAFLDNPENKPQIDHKNGIRTDNRVSNLHWVTAKENSNMPIHIANISGENNGFYGKTHNERTKSLVAESNRRRSGENSSRAQPVINLDTGERFCSLTEAAKSLGYTDKAVCRALDRGGKCGGYRWARVER